MSPAAGGRPVLPAFAAVWGSYFASIGLFNPYAPLWFKELGLSTLAIGAMASLTAWTRIVGPYGWAWLADRSGKRVQVLRLAAACTLAAAVAMLWVRGHVAVAVCTACLFLANGGIVPLSEAALSQHLSRGGAVDMAAYGRVRMWGSLGFVLSAGLFGWVLDRTGIAAFPVFVALLGWVLVLAAWRLPAADEALPPAEGRHGAMVQLRRPEVRWFFATVFLTVLAHNSLYAFLSLYLDSLGYGKGTVGLLWAVAVAVEIAFFWTQGRWFDRLTPLRWLELAAATSVLRFALMAAGGGVMGTLVLAQSLHAITFAAQHAACIAMINRHFPGALRSRGQALYTILGYGLSGVLGGLAGGWLSSRWGLATVFWAATGVSLLAWAAALRSSRLHAG